METLSLGVLHCEMYCGCCVSEDNFAGFQFAVRHIYAGHCYGVLDGLECLCLPRQCDEGEQDGDDGLLHIHFVFIVIPLYYIYDVFAEVTASESHSEPQSYGKSHEKAPDMTEKMSAEVKV